MINRIIVKLDYILFKYNHLLPYKYMNKYDMPSKRLVKHCWSNWNNDCVKYDYESIAHMWAFDSTILPTDMEFLTNFFGITRERAKQSLAKFIRMYYN